MRNDGDFAAASASAAKRLEAEYYIPHLAHATMEPPAATVRITNGKCEVWGCFQSPQAARDLVAKRLGMSPDDVTVHVTLLGGGFGRKSKPDFGIEAAVLSKAMDGKPVKVTWTRDDDLHNSYYHTVSVEHLEAGVDAQGKPVAWLHRSVAPTIISTFDPERQERGAPRAGHGRHQRAVRHSQHPHREPRGRRAHAHRLVPVGLEHPPRLRGAVVRGRAGRGGGPRSRRTSCWRSSVPRAWSVPRRWATPGTTASRPSATRWTPAACGAWSRRWRARRAGAGRCRRASGLGIAAHYSFVSYVAAVVEVAVDSKGTITIPRVDIAVDCGATVNPDRVRAQMEGAVVMGVGVATLGEISFKDGRVEQDNFDTYQVTRMTGAPREIRVHIVPGGDYSTADGRRGRARRAADPAGALQRDLRRDRQADPPACRSAIS